MINRQTAYACFARYLAENPHDILEQDSQRQAKPADKQHKLQKLAACGLQALWQEAEELTKGIWDENEEIADKSKVDKASEEYTRLFNASGPVKVCPWESVYISGERILCNENTLAVVETYRRMGFAQWDRKRGPEDHIGRECAFMAELAGQAVNEGNTKAQINEYCQVSLAFLQEHLLAFAPEFCRLAADNAKEPLYREIARSLPRFLIEDEQMLNASLEAENIPANIGEETKRTLHGAGGTEEGVTVIPTAGHNNCGGRCVIKAYVKEGCVLRLGTDEEPDTEEYPQLRACIRGRGYRMTFLNPDRLKYPLKRVGKRGEGKFKRITWEEATDIIAGELKRIGHAYGPGSRFVQYACGYEEQSMNPSANMKRLLALDGGYLGYYNSYSAGCTSIATPYTYGTVECGNTRNDYVNSKLIILWGENPAEAMRGSRTMYYLKKAKEKGAKIIVVDPRYNDTAASLADQWIPLRPATDSAMMDAMAYVILTENLQDQHFLDTYCLGFDEAHMPAGYEGEECHRSYLLGLSDGIAKTPEWACAITGVPADVIRNLAIEYASTSPAALVQGWGTQRHSNGEQAARSSALLACMTGNVGISGGCASAMNYASYPLGEAPVCPPIPDNPFPGKIPVFLWTDAITRGSQMTAREDRIMGMDKLPSDIKCIINLAGNTLINQHSDCARTAALLQDESKVEFILCSDIFMTPSARYADILLPGTAMFEEENIGGCMSGGNYLLKTNPCMEPLFECRYDYEWMCETAEKMGIGQAFSEGKSLRQWLEDGYNSIREERGLPDFETFSARGVFKWPAGAPVIAFEKQIKDPEQYPFPTKSGKIELFSPALFEMGQPGEIPAIAKYVPAKEGSQDPLSAKYPIQLIGWHIGRRCHTVHDNNAWAEEAFKQQMWMNPRDAGQRKIKEGELAEVYNDRGRVVIAVHLTERIMPGVAAMPQGAWYTPDENGVDTRGNINTLTTWRPTALAKANPQHTNLVEIRALGADALDTERKGEPHAASICL